MTVADNYNPVSMLKYALKAECYSSKCRKYAQQSCTGGPRYMQKIGTVKYDSNITNLHLKRPRMTLN